MRVQTDSVVWPAPGSQWVDATGRTLEVTEVCPGSRIGRHVVGVLLLGDRRSDYACDLPTFDLVWRERCVAAEAGDGFQACARRRSCRE